MADIVPGIVDGGSVYSRLSNPTTETTEAVINAIEKGAGSLTFSSGMAATTSVLLGFLKSGDHVIQQIPVYPGTGAALKMLKDSFSLEVTTVTSVTVEEVTRHIRPNTKMLWIETPCNPDIHTVPRCCGLRLPVTQISILSPDAMLWIETPCNPDIYVVDVEGLTQLAKSKNILVAVDGTFGSPALQHFMPLGIDFSVHSCTKYMGGHSDLIGGCVTTRTVEQWRILKHMQGLLGNMLSPHDASLLLRGLKTLSLRMERISENAMKVATYLEQHPKVKRVSYPGLPSHPQHKIAQRQMSAYSGMIMAEIRGGEAESRTVAENLRIVRLAVSLGGVESLVEHPFSMTHGQYLMTPEETRDSGITPGMLRISIGIEDAEDLIKDFEQALSKTVLDPRVINGS
ncbi:cystathionine gamma-lyase-like [Physella acuta]|uniref:cystathionine gamma-lyase-like n=1 Tax=Physella acuta TaxID=109671 RepID=UPI0027DD1F61|nr:cystathionine gamma-lyase-like [Physella acuta]